MRNILIGVMTGVCIGLFLGQIITESRWLHCPACNGKLVLLDEHTVCTVCGARYPMAHG
jgi:hypothetical protein